jgi:hypothetical protein
MKIKTNSVSANRTTFSDVCVYTFMSFIHGNYAFLVVDAMTTIKHSCSLVFWCVFFFSLSFHWLKGSEPMVRFTLKLNFTVFRVTHQNTKKKTKTKVLISEAKNESQRQMCVKKSKEKLVRIYNYTRNKVYIHNKTCEWWWSCRYIYINIFLSR